MAGNLTLDQLKKAVTAGEIDTVVAAFVDMQGRLIGKRFQAEYFRRLARMRKRMAATISSPTTSIWSRCRATRSPTGTRAMATSS